LPPQWWLFIDSLQSRLKAVLLHNWNELASLPLAHSVTLKENHKDLAIILLKIKYQEHGWIICGDFKILSTLFGQHLGFTKYACFLSSYANPYEKMENVGKRCAQIFLSCLMLN